MMFNLMKFEDIGLAFYCTETPEQRVLTHRSCADLKEKIEESAKKTKNPYKEAYIWLKGEFLDIQGMFDCLQGREGVMKALLNTEQKKKDDQKDLEKL